jgi:predicted nucleic acid-binding protein
MEYSRGIESTAAVSIRNGLRLVTRDLRDFDRKKNAFVLIPYRLR